MKKIAVSIQDIGQRLDKFLAKEFFSFTRGEIIRKIKSGDILVNNKEVKPNYALKCNDKVSIDKLVPESNDVVSNPNLNIRIIFENGSFLIIDKPAGIQVHPDTNEKKDTVTNWLVAKYPKVKNVHDKSLGGKLRPGIVHRLDKDTSGVMIIAKNQKTFNALKKLFQEKKIKKTYLAIVYGKLEQKKGIIEKPIAKAANYKRQTIASLKTKTKIRPALTEYRVVKQYNDYSLLEVFPKTGRTHQIRVHLWSLSHPVVGDKLYKFKRAKKEMMTDRQLLHASEVSFSLKGEKYRFHLPLPDDFSNFLNKSDKNRNKA